MQDTSSVSSQAETLDTSVLNALFEKKTAEYERLQKQLTQVKMTLDAYALVLQDLKGKNGKAKTLDQEDRQRTAQVNEMLVKDGSVHATKLSELWGVSTEGVVQWMKRRIGKPGANWVKGKTGREFILPAAQESSSVPPAAEEFITFPSMANP